MSRKSSNLEETPKKKVRSRFRRNQTMSTANANEPRWRYGGGALCRTALLALSALHVVHVGHGAVIIEKYPLIADNRLQSELPPSCPR